MLAGLNNANFGVSFQLHPGQIQPGADAQPGRGKKVAQAFQEAAFTSDGFQAQFETAEMGLRQIAQHREASQREKLVSQIALQQSEIAGQANTLRPSGQPSISSRSHLLTKTLALIAGGAATTGPIGAVLADIGCRQMDDIRAQGFGTGSIGDTRDANVSGRSMLEAIQLHGGDQKAQQIAAQALDQLGDRYQNSQSEKELFGYRKDEELYHDTEVLYGALNEIKTVTCQGDRNNPKCMAFLDGQLPETGFSTSLGRPGGWIGKSGPADAFSVQEKHDPFWDR